MRKKAPVNVNKTRTECFAYVTPNDHLKIQYGWFTAEEFKKTGYKQVDLSQFNDSPDDKKDA